MKGHLLNRQAECCYIAQWFKKVSALVRADTGLSEGFVWWVFIWSRNPTSLPFLSSSSVCCYCHGWSGSTLSEEGVPTHQHVQRPRTGHDSLLAENHSPFTYYSTGSHWHGHLKTSSLCLGEIGLKHAGSVCALNQSKPLPLHRTHLCPSGSVSISARPCGHVVSILCPKLSQPPAFIAFSSRLWRKCRQLARQT